MIKKRLTGPLALGLTALLLGTQPALAADTIALHGPDGQVRHFTLDSEHVLQLAGGDGGRTQVRKATGTERKALRQLKGTDGRHGSTAGLSPVLRDAAGRAYGLPGGLIITLKEPLDEAAARAQLKEAGLVPQHRIAPTIWSVESPAGLETIELANRLNAQGTFAEVSPNWWTRRTLK